MISTIAEARMLILHYKEVLDELKKAVQSKESRDFESEQRILKIVDDSLSKLEDTTIGRNLVKKEFDYSFPFQDVYRIFHDISEHSEINYPTIYITLDKLIRELPQLSHRES